MTVRPPSTSISSDAVFGVFPQVSSTYPHPKVATEERNKAQDPILAMYRGGAGVPGDGQGLVPVSEDAAQALLVPGARSPFHRAPTNPCVHTRGMQPSSVLFMPHSGPPHPAACDSGVALLPSCAWMGHMTRSVYHLVGQCDMCHSRWDNPGSHLPWAQALASPGGGRSAVGTVGRRVPVLRGERGARRAGLQEAMVKPP